MKVSIYTLILMLTVSLGATTARADEKGGLFVEPMVTYEGHSDTSIDWPAPFTNSTGSVEGFGVGARLGFHVGEIFFLGAEGRYSKPTFKDSSNNLSADADAYNYGLVAGVQAPVWGLRVWGSWIAGGELNPKEDNSVDFKFKDGQGYRIGAGIHLSIVSLNLEYQNMKYGTTEVEQLGPFATNTTFGDSELKNESYILSVSFPIEL